MDNIEALKVYLKSMEILSEQVQKSSTGWDYAREANPITSVYKV